MVISRQRAWQIKMKANKRCHICGKKAVENNILCEKHKKINIERMRNRYRSLSKEQKKRIIAYQRRYMENRKFLGLCVRCGKAKDKNRMDKNYCESCRVKSQLQVNRRKEVN